MNSHAFNGEWRRYEREVKASFGEVKDDDLRMTEDRADHLVGVIQKCYGYTRDQAEQVWRAFATSLSIERMNAGCNPEYAIDRPTVAPESPRDDPHTTTDHARGGHQSGEPGDAAAVVYEGSPRPAHVSVFRALPARNVPQGERT